MTNTSPSRRIAITGAGGLIGSALSKRLQESGHVILPITRERNKNDEAVLWSPREGEIEADKLEGIDAVVHLAGEPVFGRWTDAKKRRIRDSRVQGTDLLARTLANLRDKPTVLVSGSGIGIYGDRGDTVLDETAPPGEGFLAKLAVDWEAATAPAQDAGIRVAHLRTGMVLAADGGALAQMLPIFKLGLGGTIGSGKQWWSWITLDDQTRAIEHAIFNDHVHGPLNLASPSTTLGSESGGGCVTAKAFTDTLGKVLHRPTILPVPAFAARLVLGQFADEALLGSQRATPAALQSTGFAFNHTELESALRSVLKRE